MIFDNYFHMRSVCDASLFGFIIGMLYWSLEFLFKFEDVLAILLLIWIFIMCAYFYDKQTHYTEKVPVAIIEKYKDL